MDIVKYNAAEADILKKNCDVFDFKNPPFNPIDFAYTLTEAMLEHHGLGLAANQINTPYRIIAIRTNPIIVMYNPKIIEQSKQKELGEESCLSLPGLMVKVKRHEIIKVEYQEPNENTVTQIYSGMTARIVQHEVDHINGILFYTRANRYHREQAFKRWKECQSQHLSKT